MSTEAQPALSPQLSFSNHHLTTPQQRNNNHPPHSLSPTSYDGQSPQRGRRRSSSFSGLVSRILPSRRQEKGGTLRERFRDGGLRDAVDVVFGLVDEEEGVDDEGEGMGIFERNAHTAGGDTLADGDATRGKRRRSSLSWFFRPLVMAPEKGGMSCLKGKGDMGFQKASKQNISSPRVQETGTQTEKETEKGKSTVEEEKDIQRFKGREIGNGKKSRRRQRRSLQESGDFLGVQGANPRTGYWDASDTTSSSDTTQMLRYWKRREKARRMRLAAKTRQRRSERWKPSETAWSSLVEPDLSPIEKSLSGSPAKKTASIDRLIQMLATANAERHEQNSPVEIQESPTQQPKFSLSGEGALSRAHRLDENTPLLHPNITIRRKPVGSPPSRRLIDSSEDSVVHTPNVSGIIDTMERQPSQYENDTPTRIRDSIPRQIATKEGEHFLGKWEPLTAPDNPGERRATAISFRSVVMKQVQIHRPPVIRRPIPFHGSLINFPSGLPPVSKKDSLDARTPLSFQEPSGSTQVWAPPTILNVPGGRTLSTAIPITTTTGNLPLVHHLSVQVDGLESESQIAMRAPQTRRQSFRQPTSLRRRPNRIPLRESSLVHSKPKIMQNQMSPTGAADIVTSSGPRLDRVRITRRRAARLYEIVSPGRGTTGQRSIRTSIFTSPPAPPRWRVKLHNSAQNPLSLAFRHLGSRTESRKRKWKGVLTPEKVQEQVRNITKRIGSHRRVDVAIGDGDDTVDPFGTIETRKGRGINKNVERGVEVEASDSRADSLVVWHAEPGWSVRDPYMGSSDQDGVILHPLPDPNPDPISMARSRPRPARQPTSTPAASALIGQVAACWDWIVGHWLDPAWRAGPRPEEIKVLWLMMLMLMLFLSFLLSKLQEIGLSVAAALLAAAIHISVMAAMFTMRGLRLLAGYWC